MLYSVRGADLVRFTYRILRALARFACWLFAPIEVVGRERIPSTGPVILVSNHRSLIDGPLLFAFSDRPIAFVAAAYLFHVPVVGWFVRQAAVPTGSVPGMRKTISHLEQGHVVGLFPEGEVRNHDSLERLGDIAAFMASKTGATVVPIAIRGADKVIPLGKFVPQRRHRVQLIVGEPRTVPPGLKRAELLKITTEWMAELFAMNRP
jgi:1-acyl-sn-glycerol-3-phosphate acyltransferase